LLVEHGIDHLQQLTELHRIKILDSYFVLAFLCEVPVEQVVEEGRVNG
jgi:hypothetical protein